MLFCENPGGLPSSSPAAIAACGAGLCVGCGEISFAFPRTCPCPAGRLGPPAELAGLGGWARPAPPRPGVKAGRDDLLRSCRGTLSHWPAWHQHDSAPLGRAREPVRRSARARPELGRASAPRPSTSSLRRSVRPAPGLRAQVPPRARQHPAEMLHTQYAVWSLAPVTFVLFVPFVLNLLSAFCKV